MSAHKESIAYLLLFLLGFRCMSYLCIRVCAYPYPSLPCLSIMFTLSVMSVAQLEFGSFRGRDLIGFEHFGWVIYLTHHWTDGSCSCAYNTIYYVDIATFCGGLILERCPTLRYIVQCFVNPSISSSTKPRVYFVPLEACELL